MALPKEPRQKMINLMYLVLTAFLALNVSAEILNAFKIVNESIKTSNSAITDKNDIIYQQFAKQMQVDPGRVGPLKAQAEQVKKLSADAYGLIDSLKNQIINESGGRNDSGEIRKPENLDATSRVMENYKKGEMLQKQLEELRVKLLSYIPESERAVYDKTFPLRIEMPLHTNKRTWTQANFDMVPVIAAVTILSKFQNDVKNSEAMVIDDLYKRINAQQFTFNQYTPLVSANAGYVMNGQKYTAKIMLGTYSSTVDPTITVNGQTIPVQAGVGTYDIVASGVGQHDYTVAVNLKDLNGQMKTFTAAGSYMVGASSVSVSADKMNVLYAGVPNPITVAAAGVPLESISASITSPCSLHSEGKGKYTVSVPASAIGKDVAVNVSAKVDNQQKNMGTMTFRVKRIPDPVARVAGKTGGIMGAAVFRAQLGVTAEPEDFVFEARFQVTGFTMGFNGSGFPDYLEDVSHSPLFTSKMKEYMRRCQPGSRVYIDHIKVKGPDGVERNLEGAIIFNLN